MLDDTEEGEGGSGTAWVRDDSGEDDPVDDADGEDPCPPVVGLGDPASNNRPGDSAGSIEGGATAATPPARMEAMDAAGPSAG